MMEPNPPGRGATPEIFTLSPEEIQRFLMRTRRDREPAHWEVRLDAQLREILQRANDFVPSAAGSILLDDPRAKLSGSQINRLTFIAAFGQRAERLLGQRVLQRAVEPDHGRGGHQLGLDNRRRSLDHDLGLDHHLGLNDWGCRLNDHLSLNNRGSGGAGAEKEQQRDETRKH